MTVATNNTAPGPWSVGDEIRKARKLAGLEQVELALAVGVARSTISGWENSHGEPTITQFRRIAQVTGASWLIGGGDIVTYWGATAIVDELQPRLPIELPPSIIRAQLAVVH